MNSSEPFTAALTPVGPFTFALAALMLAVFSGLFLHLWRRGREPGADLLSIAALMAAAFFASEAMGWIRSGMWLPLIAVSGVLMILGISQYLVPGSWSGRWWTYLAALPQAILVVIVVVTQEAPRTTIYVLTSVSYLLTSVMIMRAREIEAGSGRALIAATAALFPLAAFIVLAVSPNWSYLRYVSLCARLLMYMTILIVYMHRRQVRLEAEVRRRAQVEEELAAANALLEMRVSERTVDLQNMIAGLESFNRNVSHDLRGPLGGIASLTHFARDAMAAGRMAEAERMLGAVEKQALSSHELVAALLELARISNEPVKRSPVSVKSIVGDVVEQLRLQRRDALMPIVRVESLSDVDADPRLLSVIFANLVSNACKFSADSPDAIIEIGEVFRDGELAFFVRDNGPGFDSSTAKKLFEPFQRLKTKVSGHGVGLSIVRRAVERHGGRAWADAQPGKGACFYFTLPQPYQAMRLGTISESAMA